MTVTTTAALPPLVQESGVPFDVFIQALTEQLDKGCCFLGWLIFVFVAAQAST